MCDDTQVCEVLVFVEEGGGWGGGGGGGGRDAAINVGRKCVVLPSAFPLVEYIMSYFNQTWNAVKPSNIKFCKCPFNGSKVVACGRTGVIKTRHIFAASFRTRQEPGTLQLSAAVPVSRQ